MLSKEDAHQVDRWKEFGNLTFEVWHFRYFNDVHKEKNIDEMVVKMESKIKHYP